MTKPYAPIALFVYNRLSHTEETVKALQKNILAGESDLFIFSDGPKNDTAAPKVLALRAYLKTVTGFASVTIIEREKNMGLANSIIAGVTDLVNRFGKIIVLEDDLVTSPYFLSYMNQGLAMYENDSEVVSIHGYVYPLKTKNLPETFFIKGADCWGWATWAHGWKLFEPDGKKLLHEIQSRKLEREFNFNNSFDYIKMLMGQISGRNDSWAIRWYAAAFLKNKLTLYPKISLVKNIGFDGSGIHSGIAKIFDTPMRENPITLSREMPHESRAGRKAFVQYFRSIRPTITSRIYNKIRRIFRSIVA